MHRDLRAHLTVYKILYWYISQSCEEQQPSNRRGEHEAHHYDSCQYLHIMKASQVSTSTACRTGEDTVTGCAFESAGWES